jgi:hypothetical protein
MLGSRIRPQHLDRVRSTASTRADWRLRGILALLVVLGAPHGWSATFEPLDDRSVFVGDALAIEVRLDEPAAVADSTLDVSSTLPGPAVVATANEHGWTLT